MTDAEKIKKLHEQCNMLLKLLADLKEGKIKIEDVEMKVAHG